LERIEKGDIAFDVLVTDPMSMRDLAKVAKIL
jgi:ribosomal protein L1